MMPSDTIAKTYLGAKTPQTIRCLECTIALSITQIERHEKVNPTTAVAVADLEVCP